MDSHSQISDPSTSEASNPEPVISDDQVRKRLFIFCDGTWQDGVNKKRRLTNVATLARCLEGISEDNYIQTVYYDNGVGNATSLPSRLIDGATGRGISVKIRNAYSFLSHNYNFSHNQDEIFLVGFSRGAFAVQCLASFISQTGLFQKQHLYYLRGLFALWKNQSFKRVGSGERRPVKEKLDDYVRNFYNEGLLHQVRIKACVVWDTVNALGLPTPWPRPLSFVGRAIPEAIENAFQVLALDERRAQFKPCIWRSKEGEGTYAKQCWFLGSHADVGGNGDAVLGAVALIWTIGQLQANTNATFNRTEIMKHLKHRFLEWDFHINEFFHQIKETAILSDIANSGRTSKPSWYWWLSGLKPRRGYLQTDDHRPNLQLVHFTARLTMAEGRNKSKLLRKWTTETRGDGTVSWRLGDKVLLEDKLSDDSHCKEYNEYAIFKAWRDGEFPMERTDRSTFATHVRALIQDQREELDGTLSSFISLLEKDLRFTGHHLAPHVMYSPNEHRIIQHDQN
ncbi:uncharacterized protein F4807DRAFT_232997 [Annulohypoxylon truncatum]|uniref:uncharacterized protein n=1 Tax=Annulohypoxylon truncatum TaxID=327061 RepID=UPI0020075811|nr:uncharacterized protein F4807DRAFT_232997 [Annulohypoxylon truncatum]KAI1206480.1 hypothetical protein F4807DRAFT_232997 [Annulohypoxylon truncatum]